MAPLVMEGIIQLMMLEKMILKLLSPINQTIKILSMS